MFETPEYASYIELCRALRPPRVYWRPGDLQWHPKANPDAWPGQVIVISDRESAEAASMAGNREAIWLPRLDQWLAMLEEAGYDDVRIFRDVWPAGAPLTYTARRGRIAADDSTGEPAKGPTREEAAAKLWMAVTGREAPRG